MKELFLGLIAFSSLGVFATTQKIVCKEKTQYGNYDVTLNLTLSGQKITDGEIEYSGTDLIAGLYRGQTTGDTTSDDMTISLENNDVVIRGYGWNPSSDDPNYYVVVIPQSYIGKEFDKNDDVVSLNATDDRYPREGELLENVFNVKCVSTIN